MTCRVKIGKNEPTVTWINQDNVKTDNEFEDIKNTGFKVLIKGPCDLNQIFSFIKNEDIFDCEFTYVSREKQSLGVAIEGMNHTSQIVNAYSITDEETAEICKLPICDSQMYSDSIYKNKYGMIFISILTDANLGVYRNKNNGAVFAFGEYIYPLTDTAMWKSILIKKFIPQIVILKKRICRRLRENMSSWADLHRSRRRKICGLSMSISNPIRNLLFCLAVNVSTRIISWRLG